MFSLLKISALAAMIGLGGIATGCQSDGKAAKADDAPMGVMCDKCEMTWSTSSVPRYQGKGAPITVVKRSTRSMECPDCRIRATEFLTVGKRTIPGKVVHTCATCGGEMKTCHIE